MMDWRWTLIRYALQSDLAPSLLSYNHATLSVLGAATLGMVPPAKPMMRY